MTPKEKNLKAIKDFYMSFKIAGYKLIYARRELLSDYVSQLKVKGFKRLGKILAYRKLLLDVENEIKRGKYDR